MKKKRINLIIILLIVGGIFTLSLLLFFSSNKGIKGKNYHLEISKDLAKGINIKDFQYNKDKPLTYKFTLTNTSKEEQTYELYFHDTMVNGIDQMIDDRSLFYQLKENDNIKSGSFAQLLKHPKRLVKEVTLAPSEKQIFELTLWKEDQEEIDSNGKIVDFYVEINLKEEKKQSLKEIVMNLNHDENDKMIYIKGNEENNYFWYSGKLWRILSFDKEGQRIRLITQWMISGYSFEDKNTNFENSYLDQWLNDERENGFLKTLSTQVQIGKYPVYQTENLEDNENYKMIERKVGTLSAQEYQKICKNQEEKCYLNNGLSYWTSSAYNQEKVWFVNKYGYLDTDYPILPYGIRPVIELSSEQKVVKGTGSYSNPYQLTSEFNQEEGQFLNTKTSGEYIKLANNDLYRIVQVENSLTKVVRVRNVNKLSFGKNALFNPNRQDSYVAYYLNHDFLDVSNGYLTQQEKDAISKKQTWYYGIIMDGESYLAAYLNDANLFKGEIINATVGLLRYGEVMSGLYDQNRYEEDYWYMTKTQGNKVWHIDKFGNNNAHVTTNFKSGVRPSFYFNTNVKVKKGSGTESDPYQLSFE